MISVGDYDDTDIHFT